MTDTADTPATKRLPILPLRDVVVYPHTVIPLFVGRERSVAALDQAMAGNREILLVAQTQADIDEPGAKDLYEIGTVATILQLLKLPDGTVKVLVEGVKRARLQQSRGGRHLQRRGRGPVRGRGDRSARDRRAHALRHVAVRAVREAEQEDPAGDPDFAVGHRLAEPPRRYRRGADDAEAGREAEGARDRRRAAAPRARARADRRARSTCCRIEKRIRGRVKQQMEKSQREYYLNEQMKAIQKELGEMEDAPNELAELEQKIKAAGMPKDAKEKATSELNKLKLMSPMSAEATVVRNYIDWLVKVPWKKRTKVHQDLAAAERVLEEDHYGLEKVKERILEYLAVQQRVKELKGPILCLVGPPGVGKTSLGQSIARATNRKFVRMSLGGVRDEAEIRGHRRTYIGSMPGKIVQNLGKVKVRNPLFLLDEVDKMSMDFRGDPSSALLEVLDPEQNSTFNDHYLEVDFDLSEVMFVCTANSLNIPPPLLDRMEVIRLPGYTEDEKLNIARRYLIPKQMRQNGLQENELKISDPAILDIIRYYTREAGVRNLEREIANICRKVVKQLLLKPRKSTVRVGHDNLSKLIGVRRFRYGRAEENDQVGPGHGARVDRGRRRAADDRGGHRARQGQADPHGPARRRHAGVDPGRDDGRAQPRRRARARRGLPHEERRPHPRARGRDAEGRPLGRHRHVRGARVGAHENPRALERGDDGRDHVAWRGAADRRPEGEVARRTQRRHRDRADPCGQREGPRRNTEEHQRQVEYCSRQVDRRGDRVGVATCAASDCAATW